MPILVNPVADIGCGRSNAEVDALAKKIRIERERKELTQDELARLAKVSRSSVQNMENPEWAAKAGKPAQKTKTIRKVVRFLGLDEGVEFQRLVAEVDIRREGVAQVDLAPEDVTKTVRWLSGQSPSVYLDVFKDVTITELERLQKQVNELLSLRKSSKTGKGSSDGRKTA